MVVYNADEAAYIAAIILRLTLLPYLNLLPVAVPLPLLH